MDSKNTSPYANPQPLPEKPAYNTYVGARYVPIYDGAWSSRKKYEPLVVVQYQGNSYTSKTYVPEGVNPTNENYWAQSGNYNAQVEEYRKEVRELTTLVNGFNNRITANSTAITLINSWQKYMNLFTNKNVAIFGDSLSDSNRPATTWSRTFKTLVESVGGTVDNYAHSGDTIRKTNAIVQGVTKYYDIVFVWIGINDWSTGTPIGHFGGTDETSFIYLYNSICKKLLTLNRPKIILCGLHNTKKDPDPQKKVGEYEYTRAVKGIALLYGCGFIDMFALPNVGYLSPVSAWSDDGLHFTDNYQNKYLLPFLIESMCAAQYSAVGGVKYEYNGIARPYEAFIDLSEGFSANIQLLTVTDNLANLIMSFSSNVALSVGRHTVGTWNSLIWNNYDAVGPTNTGDVCVLHGNNGGALEIIVGSEIDENVIITTDICLTRMSNNITIK